MSVLSLIAPEDTSPLGWVIQIGAVFIFFVLPVLRSIAESRKRGAGKTSAPARKRAGPPADAQQGRDMWRQLFEGRAAAQPAAPTAARKVSPTPAASSAPVAEAARPVTTHVAKPLAPLRPRAAPAARPAVNMPSVAAAIPAEPRLGTLEADPATLDDEMSDRWGDGGDVPRARAWSAFSVTGADWRRAVLLSEVLAPPLALRDGSSAWPGPPLGLPR